MKKNIFILLTLIIFCINFSYAGEEKKLDFSCFRLLPILDQGRVKPLDSFARITLRGFSGADTLDKQSASEWMAGVFFSPENEFQGPGFESGDPGRWEELAAAYREGDNKKWQNACEKSLEETLSKGKTSLFLLRLEVFYNAAKLLSWAIGLYILSLLLMAVSIMRPAIKISHALAPLALGTLVHAAAIAIRVTILHRPPVGTLYKSALFVSLVCAASAVFLSLKKPNFASLTSGTFAAICLLLLSPVLLQENESMEMLQAVLNTNFWLATHVLCITAGYAISILAACMAHIWLATKSNGEKAKNLETSIYRTSLAALLFTTVGTVLGGIWADQSWGRFWGWDPKENGALLIVLWLAWMQHGRISLRLPVAAFIAAAAFLNVIVALAWFGVNLLGTGLHSYGFTSGIAAGLTVFCVGETVLIAILWLRKKSGGKTENAGA